MEIQEFIDACDSLSYKSEGHAAAIEIFMEEQKAYAHEYENLKHVEELFWDWYDEKIADYKYC